MSSLEIAACGLPLVASRLQGLIETVEHGVTGYLFKTGDYQELASRLAELLDAPSLRNRLGENARRRILTNFTLQKQMVNLVDIVNAVALR